MRSITQLELQYAHRFYGFQGEAQYLHCLLYTSCFLFLVALHLLGFSNGFFLHSRRRIFIAQECIGEHTAVSYTHLDVYKRQMYTTQYRSVVLIFTFGLKLWIDLITICPVSWL